MRTRGAQGGNGQHSSRHVKVFLSLTQGDAGKHDKGCILSVLDAKSGSFAGAFDRVGEEERRDWCRNDGSNSSREREQAEQGRCELRVVRWDPAMSGRTTFAVKGGRSALAASRMIEDHKLVHPPATRPSTREKTSKGASEVAEVLRVRTGRGNSEVWTSHRRRPKAQRRISKRLPL